MIVKKLPQLSGFEFRSKEEISGWPLIHINIGTNPETARPPGAFLAQCSALALLCDDKRQPRGISMAFRLSQTWKPTLGRPRTRLPLCEIAYSGSWGLPFSVADCSSENGKDRY
jgi:hypothetical protein